jgi:hypothetical protein
VATTGQDLLERADALVERSRATERAVNDSWTRIEATQRERDEHRKRLHTLLEQEEHRGRRWVYVPYVVILVAVLTVALATGRAGYFGLAAIVGAVAAVASYFGLVHARRVSGLVEELARRAEAPEPSARPEAHT